MQKCLQNKKNNDILIKRLTKVWAQSGSLAQLGEHLPYKQRVIGSSPITPTIYNFGDRLYKKACFRKFAGVAQLVEHCLAKAVVASSSLVSRSTKKCLHIASIFSLLETSTRTTFGP